MDKVGRDRLLAYQLRPEALPDGGAGRRVEYRPRNFKLSLTEQMRGYLGPPAYAVRARRIDEGITGLLSGLRTEYRQLAEQCRGDLDGFARRWVDHVGAVDLDPLNKLIEAHNDYYPIEANLRVDPDRQGYLIGSVAWEPTPLITHAELLAQFPPELESGARA